MKTTLKLTAILFGALLLFTSCEDLLNSLLETPVSVTERIQSFEDDLNQADRSDVYLNFSATYTQDYNNYKDSGTVDTDFPYDNTDPYVITVTDQGNDLWEGTVTGGNFYDVDAIQFDMVFDIDGNALIDNMRVYSGTDTTELPLIEIKKPVF